METFENVFNWKCGKVNIGAFIDFTNQVTRQSYSFPKDVIDHLTKHCNLLTSDKLMECCKSLRIRQTQVGKSHFEELLIRQNGTAVSPIAREACLKMSHFPNEIELFAKDELQTEFNVTKVWRVLMLVLLNPVQFDSLMLKLDLSQIQSIFIITEYEIHDWVIEKLLQPSLKHIYITAWFQDCTQILYQFFEKCPSLKYFE